MTQSLHSARYEKFRTMLIDARKAAGLTQRDASEWRYLSGSITVMS